MHVRCPFVVTLVICALIAFGGSAHGQERTACEDIEISTVDRLSVEQVEGSPGDTVWIPVSLKTDSTVLGFAIILQYDHEYLTPVTNGYGDVLAETVGRMTGIEQFGAHISQSPGDSGAIVAIFTPLFNLTEQIPPGDGPIFRMPFAVHPQMPPGDTVAFTFLRYTESYFDPDGIPPDTLRYSCRISNLALSYDDFPVASYPTTTSGVFIAGSDQPVIDWFSATPRSVYAGEEVRIGYEAHFIDSARISPDGGVFTTTSEIISVYPPISVEYTLDVFQGLATASASVLVHAVPPGQNRYPWLYQIPDQEATVGEYLRIWVSSIEPDEDAPASISASPLPGDAVLTDFGYGEGWIEWTPQAADIGAYDLWAYAADGIDPTLVDSVPVRIIVRGVNHPPEWAFDTDTEALYEADTLEFLIQAWDADLTVPSIHAHLLGTQALAANMSFVDSGNGTGLFRFVPDYFQGNENPTYFNVNFTIRDAEDPTLAVTTASKPLRVYNRNSGLEVPVLHFSPLPPFTIPEVEELTFTITATTGIGDLPVVTSSVLPPGASLSRVPGATTDDSKIFRFYPTYTQAGEYTVTFYAENAGLVDSVTVPITVTESNQPPFLFVLPNQPDTVVEGETYHLSVIGFDADSTVPTLSAFLDSSDSLATNMTFVDSGNGVGLLTFLPNRIQGGATVPSFYYIRFMVRDSDAPYHENVSGTRTIRVYDSGLPCCLGTTGDINYSGNGSGNPNIADVTSLVAYLMGARPNLPCLGEADLDGSGLADMSDLTMLVAWLFSNGAPPPSCP